MAGRRLEHAELVLSYACLVAAVVLVVGMLVLKFKLDALNDAIRRLEEEAKAMDAEEAASR